MQADLCLQCLQTCKVSFIHCASCELKHEKIYRRTYAPNRDSNQDFVVHEKNFACLDIQNAPSEDSDQTVKVQTDLNLCLVHIFKGMFSDIVANMLYELEKAITEPK